MGRAGTSYSSGYGPMFDVSSTQRLYRADVESVYGLITTLYHNIIVQKGCIVGSKEIILASYHLTSGGGRMPGN